jgi:hypothetical protein
MLMHQKLPDLPGTHIVSLYARHALQPRRNLRTLAKTSTHCCLLPFPRHRLPHDGITGLNRFTLSHCGSHTPCPTLNPSLAASAPRTRYRWVAKPYRAWTLTTLYYVRRTGAREVSPCYDARASFFFKKFKKSFFLSFFFVFWV